jgi:hypothetical protein
MRTDTKYNENYFCSRPTLQDTGLSDALYRVGQLAAEDLRRQNPRAAATDATTLAPTDVSSGTKDLAAWGMAVAG